ncbi:MAG TPA: energy-coupling factor transporter ATPase [Clostridiaceae bacterium]|nr:energy-coupling factor transporter ATPase [Clostridiaceae bacterium]
MNVYSEAESTLNSERVLLRDVSYTYDIGLPQETLALTDINIDIRAGQHIAVLGHNGSGKSTLAHIINALLLPQRGTLSFFGCEPSNEDSIWEIRRRSGLVLQNPDNQIIGTTLEEDVAFGPENLGVPLPELRHRVDASLEKVGLLDLASRPPHTLSGGQKQKLAIAGILAMEPICLILDEATAMLDPYSRADFMDLVMRLSKERDLTVINITHNMEEALLADYIYVVYNSRIALHGTPADVFDQPAQLRRMGLDVPVHIEIAQQIADYTSMPLTKSEAFSCTGAAQSVHERLDFFFGSQENVDLDSFDSPAAQNLETEPGSLAAQNLEAEPDSNSPMNLGADPSLKSNDAELKQAPSTYDYQQISDPLSQNRKVLVEVKGLSYTYNPDLEQCVKALSDLSVDIYEGELLGLAGHSGSGKSTFVQHLNGLIRPEPGVVSVMGLDVHEKKNIRKVREHLGLLFQYPEQQLFEETVGADIAFGPKQMGLPPDVVEQRVKEAAELTGLDIKLLERSPFDLSGGQMRRVATAGILAMNPDILILDEPTAGLDPAGRDELLSYILRLQQRGQTIILISHDMDQLAGIADRILILKDGKKFALGTPAEVFSDEVSIRLAGLDMPNTKVFMETMQGWAPGLATDVFTPDDAAEALINEYRTRRQTWHSR